MKMVLDLYGPSPKTYNLSEIMRKTSNKSELRNILQNT